MDDRWIIDRVPTAHFQHYTRANAGEVLSHPVTPLAWSFVWEAGVVKGCRDGFVSFGVLDFDEYDTPEQPQAFGLFGGYLYNCLSQVRLMGARMPGASPEAIDQAYFDPRDDVPPYVEEPWHVSPSHEAKLAEAMAWVMSGEPLHELDVERDLAARVRAERPDLSALPDAALIARARSLQPRLQQMFEHHVWSSLGASLGPGALGAITTALGDGTMAVRLIAGIGEVDSAAPSWTLWDLSRRVRTSSELTAQFDRGVKGLADRLQASSSPDVTPFLQDFAAFLVQFGSRGPNEWDLLADTWETRPDLALAAIERMRLAGDDASPTAGHAAAVAERERLAAELREKLAGDAETLGTFEAAMKSAGVWLAARERTKTNVIRLIGEIRMCFLELGARMAERGALDRGEQIFMLLADELDAFRFQPERFTDTLRRREQEYRELFDLEPPFIVSVEAPPIPTWKRRADRKLQPVPAGTVLTGTAGSGGTATGTARVLHDPYDPSALEPGDILVADSTDPSWTPLFVPAGGVVAAVGAMGSHTMIVSRELGIPCVVSVEDATLKIPDGATITVDGSAGTVTVH